MSPRYVVVDGSNLATEGRSIPSLAQLDEAVRAFMVERPSEQVIVVVDASFGYRIDESERNEYEAAEAAGEIVSPPAGAIGRGDGFLLRIADRTDAVVLSNDSFQEFHAEYGWLFDQGRLIGGKPVPGVGWIFTPRAPVRGPRSREALRQARKAQKASPRRATVAEGPVADAIAEATKEAIAPDEALVGREAEAEGDGEGEDVSAAGESARGGRRSGQRRRHAKPAGSVNDPFPFIQFIADHPLGTEVMGEVDSFTSHGAFVQVGAARCYVPLVALGDPPPRSAKSVLTRGETRQFVVQALDPPRRGIELALPELARVAGTPTEETVEADIGAGRKARMATKAAKAAKATKAAAVGEVEHVPAPEPLPAKARRSRKKAAPADAAAPEPVAEAAEAAPPEPAPAKRSRKKAVGPTEAVPEPLPPKAARPRKKAAPAAAEAVPQPEPVPEPAPAPAKKAARKKAAALAAPSLAAPVKKARAKKAPAAVEKPPTPPPTPPAAAPVKKARTRKKAAG